MKLPVLAAAIALAVLAGASVLFFQDKDAAVTTTTTDIRTWALTLD